MLSSPALQRLPPEIWQHLFLEAVSLHSTLRRRLAMLGIIWNEGGLTKSALQVRVEALVGMGCFGRQPTLTFARDIRFLRQVLDGSGFRLQYRRSPSQGYWIIDRPVLAPAIEKKLSGAFSEVSPEQAAIFARLTPAERVWQGATLSDQLRTQAAHRLMREQSNLSVAEAHREVLSRMYRLER